MTNKAAPLALITGGFRRVGAAIAAHFSDHGYSLALHGHSDIKPEEALQNTLTQNNTQWQGFGADLRQADAAAILMDAVINHFGRAPDVLINNASLFQNDTVDSQTQESFDAHMAVNFRSPLFLTKALIERSDRQVSIIQIIDQRVRNPNKDQTSYTLSKQAFAESIRTQARSYGKQARINGIAPGFTLAPDGFDDTHIARIAGAMPLEINSKPQDIAQAAFYLVHAKAVTGQLLFVDGGAHMESYARDFEFM